jgi:NAD(P)-dependent dehydrogenase (short-subunit alcohol dehydrogenase family)
MASWSATDIPDQSGRTFVVTGANSGLGAVTTRALAGKGARVVMACRNVAKAEGVAGQIAGDVTVRRLDLSDLSSVRAFAADLADVEHIDVLVNNAGVMAVPKARTADGFELQFGTNFLGHFALTGLLLPRVSGRVVTLSSQARRLGKIDLDDVNWHRRRYRRWLAYAQSKLADLMFAIELQRRLTVSGSPVLSVAAHPGYAATELQSHTESVQDRIMAIGNRILAQSADMGALPTLYAATMPDVSAGDFYGPGGLGEMRGHPTKVAPGKAAQDTAVAAKLWGKAEALTGVRYG